MASRRPALSRDELAVLAQPILLALDSGQQPDAAALKVLVKELAAFVADKHPGRTVEVRIPPYTAVQCIAGPRHTRGTPPNVVESEAVSWVLLCTGRCSWQELVRTGRISASGERSDLSGLFPLVQD